MKRYELEALIFSDYKKVGRVVAKGKCKSAFLATYFLKHSIKRFLNSELLVRVNSRYSAYKLVFNKKVRRIDL